MKIYSTSFINFSFSFVKKYVILFFCQVATVNIELICVKCVKYFGIAVSKCSTWKYQGLSATINFENQILRIREINKFSRTVLFFFEVNLIVFNMDKCVWKT